MCVCVHNRIDNCSSCSYSYRRLFCSHKPPACVRLRSVAMKELTLWRALSLAPPTNSASFAYCAFGGKAVLGCVFVAGAPPMRPARVAGNCSAQKKKKKTADRVRQAARADQTTPILCFPRRLNSEKPSEHNRT